MDMSSNSSILGYSPGLSKDRTPQIGYTHSNMYLLKKTTFKSKRSFYFALSILLIVLASYFLTPDVLQLIELRMLDTRIKLRGFSPPPDTVKLITLDRTSRNRYGLDHEMRMELANVLEDLCQKGAAAIGLDLYFAITEGVKSDRSSRRLAEALDHCGNIALGYRWNIDLSESRLAKAESIGRRELLRVTTDPNSNAFRYENLPSSVEAADHQLMKRAQATGYYTVINDPDNVVRKIPATLNYENTYYYPFSLAIVRAYLDTGAYGVAEAEGKLILDGPSIEGVNIMPDPSGYLWLNYFGPRGSFVSLRFDDVVREGVPESFASGSIILIGVSGYDSNDLFKTPCDDSFPGVSIHATAVANALSDGFLWRDYRVRIIEVSIMVLFAILLAVGLPRLYPILALLLGPLLLLIFWVFAQHTLKSYAMWIHIVQPFCLILLEYTGLIALRMIQSERRIARALTRRK